MGVVRLSGISRVFESIGHPDRSRAFLVEPARERPQRRTSPPNRRRPGDRPNVDLVDDDHVPRPACGDRHG
jgi:hypothetical protein